MASKDERVFFLVVPPGFEDLALLELNSKFPGCALLQRVKGGIEISCAVKFGFALNRGLRLPTRILMRLATQPCMHFEQLREFINTLPWQDFLSEIQPKLQVSSQNSKLYHRERITDVSARAIRSYFRERGRELPKNNDDLRPPEVHIRMVDNHCTLSIDTSGEELFKRGYKTLRSQAPLRENLAAGIFWQAYSDMRCPSRMEVVDPMCGTGTLLSEAVLFSSESRREFAFESFPAWADQTVKRVREAKEKNNSVMVAIGRDRQAGVLAQVHRDWSEQAALKRVKLDAQVGDALGDLQIPPKKNVRIVFANPPYGERLKLPVAPQDFYPNMHQRLLALEPDWLGYIVPKKWLKYSPPTSKSIAFMNGTIPVSLQIYLGNSLKVGAQ